MSEVQVTTTSGGGDAPLRRSRDLRQRLVRALPLAVTLAVILVVWSALTYSGFVSRIVLPTPSAVGIAFWDVITTDSFPENLRITMAETIGGGLVGMGIGISAGCIVGVSRVGRSVVQPIMVTLQAVPALVLAPLMLIWFGYGMSSKIALVILSTFFPVFVTTVEGIRSTPDPYLKLLKSFRSSSLHTFFAVRLPNAAPHIFAGIRASIASAFSAAIVAEFVGALRGLGVQVLVYNEALQIPHVFALVLVMVIIGILLYYMAELLDRRIVFWRGR